jgi:hypothetical protein
MKGRSLDSRAMPRLLAGIISVALGVGCAGLVSCGGGGDGGLIPGDDAAAIIDNLDEIAQLAQDGNCVTAADHASEVQDQVDALPSDVDPDLKQALKDSVSTLRSLAGNTETCTGETVPTETTETTETQEPTFTEETETEKTDTQRTQTEPTTTAGGGVGPGGGIGPGGGGGGGGP